jgi:hypothetical protein
MLYNETGSRKHTLAKNFAYEILVAVRGVKDWPQFFTANLNGDIGDLDEPQSKPSTYFLVTGLQRIGFEGMGDVYGLGALLRRGRPPLLLTLSS